MDTAIKKEITTVCVGKPHLHIFQVMLRTAIFNQLLRNLASKEIDIVILS
jgi:two-component system sensor histidine kinase KdpD